MALIISIETSTKVCSVAVHSNNMLLGVTEFYEDQSHSKLLIDQINYILKYTGYSLPDIDGVAVSMGPGSYTGLRIGVATAKGLCFTLVKPLIAVNTLEAMGFGINKVNPELHDLCPMLDARRMEVYCCLMRATGEISIPTQAIIIDNESFNEQLKERKTLFFGNGSEKCYALLSKHAHALFLKDICPSAVNIGYLAAGKFDRKEFEDIAYFEPYYLKEFISTQKNQNGN